MTKNKGLCEFNKKTKKGCYQEGGREYSNTQENTKCYSISSVLITLLLDSVRHLHMAVRFYLIVYVKKGHKWVTTDAESALSFDITWSKAEAVTSCLYYSSNLIFSSIHSFFFTCDVDMRDVSWRPVRSDEEMFTGAPRWRRILTFLSFSKP